MKKVIFTIFAILVLVPAMAQAEFRVPEQSSKQNAQVSTEATAPEALKASGITNAVKKAVRKSMAGVSKKMDALKAEFEKKDTETSKSIDALGQKIDSQAGEIKKIGEDAKILDKKLTGKNGEFERTRDAVKAVDSSLVTMAIGIVTALTVFGLIFFILLKKTLNRVEAKVDGVGAQVDDVQAAVDEVPEKVKALDPMVIDIVDVSGEHVVYTPPIIDGMYVTLHVPSTVTVPVADPGQIIRTRTTDKGAVRRSTRKTVAAYLAATAAGAPAPTTEQEKQQLALILHLLGTDELKFS